MNNPRRFFPLSFYVAFFIVLLCGGCAGQVWTVPVTPPPRPGPGPTPGPIVPVPTPVPPAPGPTPPVTTGVAAWSNVERIGVGMLRADVETTLAVTPAFTSTQDDGTVLADYASVDADGKPEYLSVRYRGGKVIGRSRIPRAAPAPVAFNGGGCENGVCALPRSRP